MTDLVVAGMAYFEVFVPPHERPRPGEELFVEGITLGLGGALNTASVAAALGLRVTLCVPMGGGIVDQAVAALAERLGITLAPMAAPDNPAVSLVFSDTHDRAFVSAARLDALAHAQPLPDAAWVHVPGLEEADRLAPGSTVLAGAAHASRSAPAGVRAISTGWHTARDRTGTCWCSMKKRPEPPAATPRPLRNDWPMRRTPYWSRWARRGCPACWTESRCGHRPCRYRCSMPPAPAMPSAPA